MNSETRSRATCDLGDQQGRQSLRGLVDEQQAIVVQEGPADREHLLLPSRERPGRLLAALTQLGEQVVDEVVSRLSVPFGEAQVLVDRQRREDITILRDVPHTTADDPVRPGVLDVVSRELDRAPAFDEPHEGSKGRRLADAVSAEQRRDAAVGHVERDPLQDVRLTEIDVQVANGDEGRHYH